jgi:undecaprenyl-diphosphatase
MPVTILVALIALTAAAAVWALSRSRTTPDPADPEAEERWLVQALGRHRRVADVARTMDRQVIGGALLVFALVVVFATALVVGLLFDMVDRQGGMATWDQSVAEWGSRNATTHSTRVLDLVTDLGGTAFLTVALVAVAVFDYVRHRDPAAPLFLAVTMIGVVVVNNALKHLVSRERPPVEHLVEASGWSFPSGHSSAAAAAWFAFALVVTRDRPRRWRAVAAGIAALLTFAVAASRVLLGVHWLTDVVAGVALGWGWFFLCALIFGGRVQRLGDPAARLAGEPVAAPTDEARPPSLQR